MPAGFVVVILVVAVVAVVVVVAFGALVDGAFADGELGGVITDACEADFTIGGAVEAVVVVFAE